MKIKLDKKKKKIKNFTIEGNIIEEYKIGNTIIQICDDSYKDKSKEDIVKILENCKNIAHKYILCMQELGM